MQQRFSLRRARDTGTLSGAPVLVSGQGWLGWFIGGLFTSWLLIMGVGLGLMWWHGETPSIAAHAVMLGSGVAFFVVGSWFFSLRVEVYRERIVVRNWWWRGEAHWEEITKLASSRAPEPLVVVPVYLERTGRRVPLPLYPPFVAQRDLVPYVFERVYEANPAVIVDEVIFRRFELGVPTRTNAKG